MAVAIMETLQIFARKNRTIALTIHQPNSIITSMFHDFMLLAGGELVYFGEWEGAVPFFTAAGLHCPQFSNPTDFFLHSLQDQANVDALVEQQRRKGTGSGTTKSTAGADVEATGSTGAVSPVPETKDSAAIVSSSRPEVPFYYQSYVLCSRNLRNYWRNPIMLFAELAQYLFMGIFVGLM